ncbi:MAG: 50S ribosomal protein L15 [Alphaproteobacteria bacterium]|nr:50S ribosomal protein L15 [Alphaproteobacteria bacterium]
MRLNQLHDKPGARKARTRVGRGIGSGHGKTAGRGMKGQKSRSGVALKGFEGGQMPIHRRLPKRGFNNIHGARFSEIGLARLQDAIDKKMLDASKPITEAVLKESGVITHLRDGVRVLGNGEIKAKVTLEVAGATASAVAAIEAAGGTVTATRPKRERAVPPAAKTATGDGAAAADAPAAEAPGAGEDAAASESGEPED